MRETSSSQNRRMHLAPADHEAGKPGVQSITQSGAPAQREDAAQTSAPPAAEQSAPALARVVKRKPAERAPVPTPMTKAPPPPPPPQPEAYPEPAPPARPSMTLALPRQLRVSRRVSSFALSVLLPALLAWAYLTFLAEPQYRSVSAFSVRSAEGGIVGDALSGLARFTGGSSGSDGAILAAFIEGPSVLERLNSRLDLVRHYGGPYPHDPLFALNPNATIERQVSHWNRMVRVNHDTTTGLLQVRVAAFSPEMAQLIAREILVESRSLLAELNAEAHADAMALSERELRNAQARLTEARAALTRFRAEEGIVDPSVEVAGRAAILRDLQGQLAQAIIRRDLEGESIDSTEARRVEVLRNRIAEERTSVGGFEPAPGDGWYPATLAQHEYLTAEMDFAEATYRSARLSRDATLAHAARQSRFLAVVVQPTLSETASFPKTGPIVLIGMLILSLFWAIGSLTRQAIADRR